MIWCIPGNGRPRLRDLGECEVKHGVRLHLVNLYAEPLGNAAVPQKFQQTTLKPAAEKPARRSSVGWIAALVLVAILVAGAAYYFIASSQRRRAPPFPKNRSRCCRWSIPPAIRLTSTSPTACRRNSSLRSRVCRTSRSSGAPRLFSSKARPTTARRSAKSSASIICSKAACASRPIGCASRWR